MYKNGASVRSAASGFYFDAYAAAGGAAALVLGQPPGWAGVGAAASNFAQFLVIRGLLSASDVLSHYQGVMPAVRSALLWQRRVAAGRAGKAPRPAV